MACVIIVFVTKWKNTWKTKQNLFLKHESVKLVHVIHSLKVHNVFKPFAGGATTPTFSKTLVLLLMPHKIFYFLELPTNTNTDAQTTYHNSTRHERIIFWNSGPHQATITFNTCVFVIGHHNFRTISLSPLGFRKMKQKEIKKYLTKDRQDCGCLAPTASGKTSWFCVFLQYLSGALRCHALCNCRKGFIPLP